MQEQNVQPEQATEQKQKKTRVCTTRNRPKGIKQQRTAKVLTKLISFQPILNVLIKMCAAPDNEHRSITAGMFTTSERIRKVYGAAAQEEFKRWFDIKCYKARKNKKQIEERMEVNSSALHFKYKYVLKLEMQEAAWVVMQQGILQNEEIDQEVLECERKLLEVYALERQAVQKQLDIFNKESKND